MTAHRMRERLACDAPIYRPQSLDRRYGVIFLTVGFRPADIDNHRTPDYDVGRGGGIDGAVELWRASAGRI